MIRKAVFGAHPTLAAQRRAAFLRGMRIIAPGTVATAVWGLVTGVAMVKTGLTQAEALGMTLLVYAGSAQLAALPLIAAGAPVWVVLATALVVNLRFVIFSATLQPYFQRLSFGRRVLLGYLGRRHLPGRLGAGALGPGVHRGARADGHHAADARQQTSGSGGRHGGRGRGAGRRLPAQARPGGRSFVWHGGGHVLRLHAGPAARMSGMSSTEVWLTIVGLTLVTVVTRGAFLLIGERINLPERVQHALRYAPACALAALVAPELLMQDGQVFLSFENFKLAAAVVAGVVMLTTRNVLFTMAVGMLLFTLLRLA